MARVRVRVRVRVRLGPLLLHEQVRGGGVVEVSLAQ